MKIHSFLLAAMMAFIVGCTHKADDATIKINQGMNQLMRGDFDGAILEFTGVIQVDRQNSTAYYSRGYAKYYKSDFDGAITDCDKAIQLNPQYAYAYDIRALAKSHENDLTGALADFDQAIKLDPQYIYAYGNRGLAKCAQGNLDGAISDYTRVIELDPQSAYAYSFRGYVKFIRGDLTGAVADFNQAIEINPRYVLAYFNRGVINFAKGRLPQAQDDFEKFPYSYSRFFSWLIEAQKPGRLAAANQELSGFLQTGSAGNDEWSLEIGHFLVGDVSEADFLQTANSSDAEQKCQAYFYAGMKDWVAGDRTAAKGLFERCVQLNAQTSFAYQLAQVQLKQLQIN